MKHIITLKRLSIGALKYPVQRLKRLFFGAPREFRNRSLIIQIKNTRTFQRFSVGTLQDPARAFKPPSSLSFQ